MSGPPHNKSTRPKTEFSWMWSCKVTCYFSGEHYLVYFEIYHIYCESVPHAGWSCTGILIMGTCATQTWK